MLKTDALRRSAAPLAVPDWPGMNGPALRGRGFICDKRGDASPPSAHLSKTKSVVEGKENGNGGSSAAYKRATAIMAPPLMCAAPAGFDPPAL